MPYRDRARHRACQAASRRARYAARKRMCVLWMGGRCELCGDAGGADQRDFEFDHNTGVKLVSVTKVMTCTWDRLFDELTRCQLLCTDCHHALTAARQMYYEEAPF